MNNLQREGKGDHVEEDREGGRRKKERREGVF